MLTEFNITLRIADYYGQGRMSAPRLLTTPGSGAQNPCQSLIGQTVMGHRAGRIAPRVAIRPLCPCYCFAVQGETTRNSHPKAHPMSHASFGQDLPARSHLSVDELQWSMRGLQWLSILICSDEIPIAEALRVRILRMSASRETRLSDFLSLFPTEVSAMGRI